MIKGIPLTSPGRVLSPPLLAWAAMAMCPFAAAAQEPAPPAEPEESRSQVSLYARLDWFSWEEYDAFDVRLLRESGPIWVAGAEVRPAGAVRIRGELFAGVVNYDGQTQSGTPVTTDTSYFGWRSEFDLLQAWQAEKWEFDVFGGPGVKWWARDIQDSGGASGYTEEWFVFYGRVGAEARHAFSPDWQGSGGLSVGATAWTRERVDAFDVTLHPRSALMAGLDLGVKWRRRLYLGYSYELMVFRKSGIESGSFGGIPVDVFQPQSETRIHALTVAVDF